MSSLGTRGRGRLAARGQLLSVANGDFGGLSPLRALRRVQGSVKAPFMRNEAEVAVAYSRPTTRSFSILAGAAKSLIEPIARSHKSWLARSLGCTE